MSQSLQLAYEQASDYELLLARWKLKWTIKARCKQVPPGDHSWSIYGIRAGRGFGKTEAGANWLGLEAAQDANSLNFVISPTFDDVKETCFEGPTGLYACIPPELIKKRDKGLPSITLWNGAFIRGFAAQSPERLRGPQCLVGDTLVTMGDGSLKELHHVLVGEYVLTRRGPRRVLYAGCTQRNAELWQIESDHAHIVRGTMDHPVYVRGKGFVPLWQLQVGQPLCSMGAPIGSVLTAITYTPTVSGLAKKASASAATCTGTSGNRSTGLCLRGFWSTTWTAIAAITTRAISALSRCLPTCKLMLASVSTAPSVASDCKRGFIWFGQALPSKGARASNVAQTSTSACSRASSEISSAPLDARTDGVTRLARVERLARSADVYDIEVEGAHEFYANGILVHNCHRGWLDEIASWVKPQKAWDNYRFGLRLGREPQTVWTSTLKPTPFIRKLLKMRRSILVQGSTYENRENLAPEFFESISQYEGTVIGRQEIYGELIDPTEAGFVKRSQWRQWPSGKPLPKFEFVLLSLDTAFTEKTFDKKEQTGDPTALSAWGVFNHEGKTHVMLLDCWEDYLGMPELIKRVKMDRMNSYGAPDLPLNEEGWAKFGRPMFGPIKAGTGRKADLILIEDKGSGISLRQTLAMEDILTEPYNPGKMDKLARLHAVSPLFSNGRVWAVESGKSPGEFRTWAIPLIEQVCTYVGAGSLEHDDLLDSATQALKYVADRFMGSLTKPPPTKAQLLQDAIDSRGESRMVNVYG